MLHRPIRLIGLALAMILAAVASEAAEKAPAAGKPKTVRLLTVGNSFSQNATRYLEDIVKADGNILVHHRCVIGGSGFAQHMEKAQRHERDPKDKLGLYGTGMSLKQELVAEKWDFITIQQASFRSHDVSTYRPSAKQLYDYIKKSAPGSEVVIHQTWAYRIDDPRFSVTEPKPGEPRTQKEMYDGLSQAYQTIAKELGIRRIPVGDAFYLADTDANWGYRKDTVFDITKARPPALPDQSHSLHMGWSWPGGSTVKPALKIDGHHANLAGEYLGACVFYEMMFGASVVGNTFNPPGLKPEDVRFLQSTAHKAVEQAK